MGTVDVDVHRLQFLTSSNIQLHFGVRERILRRKPFVTQNSMVSPLLPFPPLFKLRSYPALHFTLTTFSSRNCSINALPLLSPGSLLVRRLVVGFQNLVHFGNSCSSGKEQRAQVSSQVLLLLL